MLTASLVLKRFPPSACISTCDICSEKGKKTKPDSYYARGGGGDEKKAKATISSFLALCSGPTCREKKGKETRGIRRFMSPGGNIPRRTSRCMTAQEEKKRKRELRFLFGDFGGGRGGKL